MSEESFKAFVSYKWESDEVSAWVERFARDLRLLGIDVLLDRWEVGFGDSFVDYMTSGLQKANIILLIVTPEAVNSIEATQEKGGALKFEAKLALARQIAGSPLKIVPVLLRGERVPFSLGGTRYADFRNEDSYQEMLIALVNDLRGDRGKPPLGGTGHLKYAGVVLHMYPAVKGGPLRPFTAQSEPFVGFPFYSEESDYPTAWPPRVYEDRKEFTRRFTAIFTDESVLRAIEGLTSQDSMVQIETRKSRPSSAEEEDEERLIRAYEKLRGYYSYEIERDETKLRATLNTSLVDSFLALEGERVYIEDQMPNRILIVRCIVDGPLPLTQVSLTLYVHGDVYDVTFDDERLLPIQEIKSLLFQRRRIRLPELRSGQVHELRVWYNYTSLADRWDPKPAEIAVEPTQGLRMLRFEALGSRTDTDSALCENIVAYHRYAVDIAKIGHAMN